LIKTELARSHRPDCVSSSHLSLDDYALKIYEIDQGVNPATGNWNDRDWDGGITVSSASMPMLCYELLKEKYAGDVAPVYPFRDWCKSHGIAHSFDGWPLSDENWSPATKGGGTG
jgi:hypothetical protein